MKFLIISDLDNTWVGNDAATIRLQKKLQAERDRFYLVYATGRSFASAVNLMREFWLTTGEPLLAPDCFITGVGSEIYHQGILDYDWAAKISQNWNRSAILPITQAYPQLLPQPESELNPWKISFCLSKSVNSAILDDLKQDLMRNHLAANVVFSSGRDVDILPPGVDKGTAALYIREKFQIPLERTLMCGDSGNDLSLYQHSTLGVIVHNAQPELLSWYQQQANPHIYYAPSSYADGILDAIAHFGLIRD
ncbi:MAG: sucrose-phosphate phosphatase [Snowella sp.]|nr:sucrose-phosphate phosphatase [Snowella sp.]